VSTGQRRTISVIDLLSRECSICRGIALVADPDPRFVSADRYPASDGSSRVCELQRNAGARQFQDRAELNAALTQINAAGGSLCPNPDPRRVSNRVCCAACRDDLKLGDNFSSLDLRVSKVFRIGERWTIEPIAEVFNLFNVTNVLGVSNVNYSGFSNVLVRDSNDPSSRWISAIVEFWASRLRRRAVCSDRVDHARFSSPRASRS
jgi:hypothetical protein